MKVKVPVAILLILAGLTLRSASKHKEFVCPFEQGCVSQETLDDIAALKRDMTTDPEIKTVVPKQTYVLDLYGQPGTYNIPYNIHLLDVTDPSQVFTKCSLMPTPFTMVHIFEGPWIDQDQTLHITVRESVVGFCIFLQR